MYPIRRGESVIFLLHLQRYILCDKVLNATLHTCPREHLLLSLSLHFPLLALHALLNGTDGRTLAITHCIAWLISVLLQVQRCQAGAAGLPWLPLRPLILWLVSSLPAPAHLVQSAASKLLFPALFAYYLFILVPSQFPSPTKSDCSRRVK